VATVATLVHMARQSGYDVYEERKKELREKREREQAEQAHYLATFPELDDSAGEWEPDRLSQQANAERLIAELDGTARFNVSMLAFVEIAGFGPGHCC
jgi:hypothetical protein